MSREIRAIVLNDLPDLPQRKYESTRVLDNGGVRTLRRQDDVVIVEDYSQVARDYPWATFGPVGSQTQTTRYILPAYVSYQYILNCICVQHDSDYNCAPWEAADGYAHCLGSPDVDASVYGISPDSVNRRQGVVSTRYGDRRVIILQDDCHDIFAYYREHGASRQVAREMQACAKRQRLAQLVTWHTEGWDWYVVIGDLSLGPLVYHDSCGGIADEDYARREIVPEVASEIVWQLEADGFTVVDKPSTSPKTAYLQARRENYRRQLHQQDWSA